MRIKKVQFVNETWHYVRCYTPQEQGLAKSTLTLVSFGDNFKDYCDFGKEKDWKKFIKNLENY